MDILCADPICDTVPVTTLVRVSVDPFPSLSDRLKRKAMALSAPEESSHGHASREQHRLRREDPGLLGWLLGE